MLLDLRLNGRLKLDAAGFMHLSAVHVACMALASAALTARPTLVFLTSVRRCARCALSWATRF